MKDLEKLLATCLDEGLLVRTSDGRMIPSEQGQVYACDLMGGRDLRNSTTAIMRCMLQEGTFIEDADAFKKLPWATVYFIVLKTVDMVSKNIRDDKVWEQIVTELEDKYLEPEGYFDNSRSRAFLKILDD